VPLNATFLKARIAHAKELITALEAAELQLADGTIEHYTLNTGQTVTTVTKSNLHILTAATEAAYNRLATLEARLGGCGTATYAAPGW
jgi:hypothetical protein